MSCNTGCDRNTSKRVPECLSRMSDARVFTDYSPRCVMNLRFANGQVMNSYDFRQYLQHNAESLMDKERTTYYEETVCSPCYDFNEDGTMLPEGNKFVCNEHTCTLNTTNNKGFGTGRDFSVRTNNPTLQQFPKLDDKKGWFSWFL